MQRFLIHWFVNAVALLAVVHIVPGIRVENWLVLIVAALVLGILNAIIRPLLLLVTLPFTVLTLGVFIFFINAFLFYLAAVLVRGFTVAGFASAFWGALLFGIIGFILNLIVKPSSRGGIRIYGRRDARNPHYPNAIDAETVPEDKKKEDHARLKR